MNNPLFDRDFYKIGHVDQYAAGIETVWSNWTGRSTRVPGMDSVVYFAGQQFVHSTLIDRWQLGFFRRPLSEILREYRALIQATLHVQNPRTDHIEYLHGLRYLPLVIYALPEGTEVPLGVPMLVLANTDPKCFWLPNFMETDLSAALWMGCTSATTALRFRRLFLKCANIFGEHDTSFVDWQGHDFSYRGMPGREAATLSGMGHLLSFNGTDTIPAIVSARIYYGADLGCGGSVPATEHSVMCAGGQDGEFETFRRLITETYPTGIVSIVSDTWDLWKVLTDYIPRLREAILARDGKVVIRPDSGDPVKIMLGDLNAPADSPARVGAIELLARAMGTDGRGHINKAGLIYGDGISIQRADAILSGCIAKGLSPYNIVFGIGSYTYQYVTRDEYGFAMKATAVRRNGKIIDIFKKPITSDGFSKASLKGIPAVYRDGSGKLFVQDGVQPEALDNCEFRKVFENGRALNFENFDTIRKRVRG